MSDEYRYQATFKVPVSGINYQDVMVNVRANDPQEFDSGLDEVGNLAARIAEVGTLLYAAGVASSGLSTMNAGPTQQQSTQPTTESSSPAPSTSAPQGQAAESGGGLNLGPDKFGRTFVLNHPDAPVVNFGKSAGQKAVKQTAQSKPEYGGGTYSQWIDPADKAVPGNWEKGLRDKGEWGPQKIQ